MGILYPGSKHMTCMLCLYYEVYAANMSETFGGI
jgi:predicted nucleic-acid-binding Zn-ribbon protein